MPQTAAVPQAKYEAAFCTAIKREMVRRGWTYKTLADALGENLHTVWNWLNGRAPLPAKKLPVLVQMEIMGPLRIIAEACAHEFKPTPGFLRAAHPSTKSIQDFQLDCYRAMAEFNKTVDEGRKDHRFVKAEKESVKAAADKTILEIMELVAKTIGGKP